MTMLTFQIYILNLHFPWLLFKGLPDELHIAQAMRIDEKNKENKSIQVNGINKLSPQFDSIPMYLKHLLQVI